jgi:hypothetical protein
MSPPPKYGISKNNKLWSFPPWVIVALGLAFIGLCIWLAVILSSSPQATDGATCGEEGHFSHSSGGGNFSWAALRLAGPKGGNPYVFLMFERYKDGTADHFVVDTVELPPNVTALSLTADGSPGVLGLIGASVPAQNAKAALSAAEGQFFDMLKCYDGTHAGLGVQ